MNCDREEHELSTELRRAQDERGYTLIELLVVILILGILATIAIPSFLNQRGKAADANAVELAHAAQVAAESYATDNAGSYANLTPTVLTRYESTLPIAPNGNSAYVASVTNATAGGYTITIAPPFGNETFSVTRSNGSLTRTCTPSTGVNGTCVNGHW